MRTCIFIVLFKHKKLKKESNMNVEQIWLSIYSTWLQSIAYFCLSFVILDWLAQECKIGEQ